VSRDSHLRLMCKAVLRDELQLIVSLDDEATLLIITLMPCLYWRNLKLFLKARVA